MSTRPTPDQFAGCLIGQCLGDALGFPVEGYPPEECAEYVAEILDQGRAGILGRGVARLREWLALPPAQAAPLIAARGADPALGGGWRGISPFVTGSVLWSLYAFLRTPEDYWTTIRTAIAVGGDVDTTAAMAGTIAGAHLGLAGLPRELASRVNDRETWTFDDLVGLARETHRLAVQ